MKNVNKIVRSGCFLFAVVLFLFSVLKYFLNENKTAIFYLIGALGFFIVYLSYLKKENNSNK